MKETAPKELDQLVSYVVRNWIFGKRWSPESECFLRHISSVVTLKIRLLSHDKIKRYARKSSQIKGRILFDNWDDYLRNELDTLQLLDKIVADVASLLPYKISPFSDQSFAGESMDCYDMDLVDEQKILVE